jgi:hypothetical protein
MGESARGDEDGKAQKMKPKSTSRRFDTKIDSTIGIEK